MTGALTWRYSAETLGRETVTGVISGVSINAVAADLREKGLKPISIDKDHGRSGRALPWRSNKSLSLVDLTVFSSSFADLLKAGVPAAASLAMIAKQSRRVNVQSFAGRLEEKLRSGETLSAALKNDPSDLPNIMTALVAAGETLGDLGGQFERLAASFDQRLKLKREMIGQMLYPAALFVLIILTLLFLSFVVLPQFESVFSGADADPPPETKFVIAAGAAIRDYWLFIAGGVIGLVILVHYLARAYRVATERLLLSLPLISSLIITLESARYCRSLSALTIGGAPLADAMPIARAAVSNSILEQRLLEMEDEVRAGGVLSRAAETRQALNDEARSFIALGEETGALGPMIEKAADHLEDRLASTAKRFAALAGPAMTALMGLTTAGVIAAVMSGVQIKSVHVVYFV